MSTDVSEDPCASVVRVKHLKKKKGLSLDFLALKIKTVQSFETSVTTYQLPWRVIPENTNLQYNLFNVSVPAGCYGLKCTTVWFGATEYPNNVRYFCDFDKLFQFLLLRYIIVVTFPILASVQNLKLV